MSEFLALGAIVSGKLIAILVWLLIREEARYGYNSSVPIAARDGDN